MQKMQKRTPKIMEERKNKWWEVAKEEWWLKSTQNINRMAHKNNEMVHQKDDREYKII